MKIKLMLWSAGNIQYCISPFQNSPVETFQSRSPKPRFLNLSTIDHIILDQIILCCSGCPVHFGYWTAFPEVNLRIIVKSEHLVLIFFPSFTLRPFNLLVVPSLTSVHFPLWCPLISRSSFLHRNPPSTLGWLKVVAIKSLFGCCLDLPFIF